MLMLSLLRAMNELRAHRGQGMMISIVISSTYAMAQQMGSLMSQGTLGFQGGEGAAGRGGGSWQVRGGAIPAR
jgi:acetylornithine/succinyldiaminopimelate/putrescine aminotransferase